MRQPSSSRCRSAAADTYAGAVTARLRRRGLVGLLAGGLALAGCGSGARPAAVPRCTAGSFVLTVEQAQNAATIAAVGQRLRLPDHAVTIALATALQESKLRNLSYGDRDSVGLFQQRPSQGWGPPAKLRVPRLSSAAFYNRLVKVPGWASLPLTEAAQRVQRSGAPDAYAQWEDQARGLARALTGEVPAGLACRFRPVRRPDPALEQTAVLELGPGGLTRTGAARTWASAAWLVAHASAYGVTVVSLDGQTWTANTGAWRPDAKAASVLAWR